MYTHYLIKDKRRRRRDKKKENKNDFGRALTNTLQNKPDK